MVANDSPLVGAPATEASLTRPLSLSRTQDLDAEQTLAFLSHWF
jgi:hypothetical protein